MKCKKCGTVLKEANYEKGLCNKCQEHHFLNIKLSGKIVFILGLLLTFGSIELLNWMVTLKIGIVSCMIYALFCYIGLRVLFIGLERMSSGD